MKNLDVEKVSESKWNDKTKIIGLWVLFVLFVIGAIFFCIQMNNATLDYEEVTVTVVSSDTKQVKNKKTGSVTNFYEVKVRYNGEVKDLENPHNTYSYPEGKSVKAYLSRGRLFANEEGVRSSTPVATVYYVFLFGSFGLLIGASVYTSKVSEKWKNKKKEQD